MTKIDKTIQLGNHHGMKMYEVAQTRIFTTSTPEEIRDTVLLRSS